MNIPDVDLKLLWGKAAGRCSHPGCPNVCIKYFEKSGDKILGEMAHVIPQSSDGPRGTPGVEGPDTYENLILLFRDAIAEHDEVASVTDRGENVYVLNRKKHPPVVVFLTDVYTVGMADLVDAKARISDLNCIVTISNWNGYTREAKEYGVQNQVGIFLFSELMGALNRSDYWAYVKHDEDGKPRYHYRG